MNKQAIILLLCIAVTISSLAQNTRVKWKQITVGIAGQIAQVGTDGNGHWVAPPWVDTVFRRNDSLIVQAKGQSTSMPLVFRYKTMAAALNTAFQAGDVVFIDGEGNFKADNLQSGETADGGTIITKPDGMILRRDKSQAHGVNLTWFGIKGDYDPVTKTGTDNWQAFMDMVNALPKINNSAFNSGIQVIHVPAGNYFFSKPLTFKRQVRLVGEGEGAYITSSNFYFPSGSHGLIFHQSGTPHGSSNKGTSNGSSLAYLGLYQQTPWIAGNAIWAHVPVTIEDCRIDGWGGDGFYQDNAAIPTTKRGHVHKVHINDPGLNYTTAPIVTFHGKGTGASATAILGGNVTSLSVTSGGSYKVVPNVQIGETGLTESNIDSLGRGATAAALCGINSLNLLTGGSGYTFAKISFSDSARAGHAVAHANIVNGVITGLVVDSPGDFENIQDSIVTDSGVVYIEKPLVLDSNGTGYTALPKVFISGDGTGATAEVNDLRVVSLKLVNKGFLYEKPPAVNFIGGKQFNGADAVATSTIGNFVVKRIRINAEGTGYAGNDSTTVTFSGGGGTGVAASVITWDDREGNSNLFRITRSKITNCANGVWAEGTDVNGGLIDQVTSTSNRLYGFKENSFLGNTYLACHTSANAFGAYYAGNNTGYNTAFISCYSEGGQPASPILWPAVVMGGDHGAGIVGTGRITEGAKSFTQQGNTNRQTVSLGANGQSTIDQGLFLSASNEAIQASRAYNQYLDPLTGSVFAYFGTSSANRIFHFTGPFTNQKFGRSTGQVNAAYFDHFFVGNGIANARLFTNATTMPTSGEYAKGDFVMNSNPNATSGIFGWYRITTGTTHIAGVDWLVITVGSAANILNGPATTQTGNFDIANIGGGNRIANYTGLTPLAGINNAALQVTTRAVDNYYTGYYQSQSGATSGIAISSHNSNVANIAVGGQQAGAGTFKPQETSMTSLQFKNGTFEFNGATGLTPGTNTTLSNYALLNNIGLSLNGTASTNTSLLLRLSNTGLSSLRIPMAGATLPTNPIAGDIASNGTDVFIRKGNAWVSIGGSGSAYTDSMARAAISLTTNAGTTATYNPITGVFNIPPGSGTGTGTGGDCNAINNGTTLQVGADFNISGRGSLGALHFNTQPTSGSSTDSLMTVDGSGEVHRMDINSLLAGINNGTGGTPLNGNGYVKMSGTTPSYVPDIPNSDLVNSTITINGTPVPLGGSVTVSASTSFSRMDVTTSSATVPNFTGLKTVVLVNYSGGTSTITLPPADVHQGKEVTVKTLTTNSVVITPVFISDANTIGANSFGAYTYYSDGTTWYLISKS